MTFIARAAAVAIALSPLAAQAADMPVFKAPPPQLMTWTGWYGGFNAGFGWRDPLIPFSGTGTAATLFGNGILPGGVPIDPKGPLGGIQFGYNVQNGAFVYGFETDIDYAAIRDRNSASGLPFATTLGDCDGVTPICIGRDTLSAEQKIDWFGTVRARGGYLVSPSALLYVTGGLAYAHATLDASVNSVVTSTGLPGGMTACPGGATALIVLTPCGRGSSASWLLGWTVGGGLEYMLDSKWSVKGEYLFYDLGSMSVSFVDPRTPAAVFSASADYIGHIARIGINTKF